MPAKSLDSQNVRGGGGCNRRYQYNLGYFAKNNTIINLFTAMLIDVISTFVQIRNS